MGHGEVEQGGVLTSVEQAVRQGLGGWAGLRRVVGFEGDEDVETARG
jgi:hypothetical protein